MLIGGLGNSVGLALILSIQYASFALTGAVYWTAEWLFANLLFGIIPMMFMLPYFNRYFFRLTGRVYLGAMVTCLRTDPGPKRGPGSVSSRAGLAVQLRTQGFTVRRNLAAITPAVSSERLLPPTESVSFTKKL